MERTQKEKKLNLKKFKGRIEDEVGRECQNPMLGFELQRMRPYPTENSGTRKKWICVCDSEIQI